MTFCPGGGALLTNRILIGQYRSGKSFAHRLDPRTKIIFIFLVMAAVLVRLDMVFYMVLIGLLLAWLIQSGATGGRLLTGLIPLLWFAAFTFIFHLIFSGRDDPARLFHLGPLSVSPTAVRIGAVYTFRIFIFVLLTFLISFTTSPPAVSEAVVSLIKPLRCVKVPVYDLGMILFIALRFIPVLAEELEMIRKAQYIRGVRFGGPLFTRVKSSVALVLPVFFSALRRADDLSTAISSRGYQSGRPRSSLYPLRFSRRDWIFLTMAVLLTAVYLFGGSLWPGVT